MARYPKKGSGVGNKLGSIRPKLTDYWTQDDIAEYFEHLKSSYKKDATLAKFVGEQLMGKAIQPLTGEDGGPIQISGVDIVVRK